MNNYMTPLSEYVFSKLQGYSNAGHRDQPNKFQMNQKASKGTLHNISVQTSRT